MSTQLKNAGEKINQELDTTGRLTAQIEVFNRESGARYEDILMPLRVWVQMRGIISAKIVNVVDGIAALDRTGAETRFGVALARLQTTMMANFVAELIDGEADEHSAASICMLAQAIRDGVEAMQGQTMEHRRQAEAVETAIKKCDFSHGDSAAADYRLAGGIAAAASQRFDGIAEAGVRVD